MRIYNKKTFVSGIFSIAIAVINLIMSIITHMDIKSAILIVLLLFFGTQSIRRSFSPALSKEDKLDELDERNRLIELKSKSKSFSITKAVSFLLMLAFLVMGKVSGYEGFIGMGVGLGFMFSISLFAELFTYFYYESRN